MENIEKLLGTLQKQSFIFNYGKREARIDLDTLLSDYDDGTSFIDYISDFYYVQSVYQKLKNNEDAEPVERFQDLSESSESYYKLLSLIKFFYSELKKCLYEIKDGEKFRHHMHIDIYEEYFYESYSYIVIDLEWYHIYINSILDKRNKILTYFIKHYDRDFPPFKKLILLATILELLTTNEAEIHISIRLIDDFFKSISMKLSDLIENFQTSLRNHLSDDKFYLVPAQTNEWFGKMINNVELSNTLNTLKGKNRRNLNCYAIAYGDDFEYYAINHLDGEERQKLHDLFTRLLPKVPAAKLTDNVRYFLPNENDFIEYGKFKNLPENTVGKFNRMFTCCERKIFANLRNRDKPINYVYIIVTQPPCIHCSRELRFINNNKTFNVDIDYPELNEINSYDRLAQTIFDS